MPPKKVFSRDDVVRAAFEVVQQVGIDQGLQILSARRVADRLGSSTAPVYSYFNSMAELGQEVVKNARQLYLDYIGRSYSDQPLLNMAIGTVLFAREQRELFLRSMFFEKDEIQDIARAQHAAFHEEIARDRRLAGLSPARVENIILQMWVFTQGLATLVCFDLVGDVGRQFIDDTLSAAATSFIESARRQASGPERVGKEAAARGGRRRR
jgi:AcrR family transcriptional regulator